MEREEETGEGDYGRQFMEEKEGGYVGYRGIAQGGGVFVEEFGDCCPQCAEPVVSGVRHMNNMRRTTSKDTI